MIKDIFYFSQDLFENFTFSVKGILRPTTLGFIIGLLILIDAIFQNSSHLLGLSIILIFLLFFTEFIRGDWRARKKEKLYNKIGTKPWKKPKE